MKEKYKDWIISTIIAFVLVGIISFILILCSISVYPVYVGYYNNSNYELSKQVCGDDLMIGIDGGCNRLTTYCEKFWFPVHTFSYCFDGRIEYVWRVKK